jgi:uncharacterized protein (DUF302 family)
MSENTGVASFVRGAGGILRSSGVVVRSVGRLAAAMVLLVGVSAAGPAAPKSGSVQDTFGVYVHLLDEVNGSVADVAAAVRTALEADGFSVLSDYSLAVDSGKCGFNSTVISIHDDAYAETVLSQGPWAAFALPLRVNVFEDEGGVHVSMVNPQSLNRTIVSETEGAATAAGMVERIRGAVAGAGIGRTASGQFGQMRSQGLIGKTMGIMAGGPFVSKVEQILSVDADDVGGVEGLVELLGSSLEAGGGEWKWGIRSMYGTMLVEGELGLVAVTGAGMEAKAMSIVGSGGDDSRSSMACAGIDHSGAFPLELVVKREGAEVNVYLIDEMFRMKMYFEDAGKMKFAMNMRMPGSIESEIRDKVDEALY